MRTTTGARVRLASLGILFVFLGWLFGGLFGVTASAVAFLGWWLFDPPRGVPWVLAAGLLAATPVALTLEGLPTSDVVGAQFGLAHVVAHRMAILALLLATFAALIELLGLGPTGRPAASEP